jgi:PAS domain S-box-containing protein
LIGQPVAHIFSEWDQSILNNTQFEGTQTQELYYEAGGQYRYLELHGGDIVADNVATGRSASHVLILYDVTDRKLAEKSRQLSEDRYRTIFESNTAATLIIEEDMTISLANDRFTSLSGYARREIEGKKKWTEFVHADDLQKMKEYHRVRRQQNANLADVPDEYEFRLLNREGDTIDVFVSVALIPDSPISIASLTDITDRKLAEQLLQQRAADLEVAVRGEQERSAIILQSVNDAIAVSDLDARTVFINRAFSQLTGYSMEEILGKHATFIVNGRIPEQMMTTLRKALFNQTIWQGELQFKRKDGTVYDAAVLIAPMRDGLGKLIGYVSSHRDITESKRLEESRRRFITNISHELRTPVTNLKLYIDLLQRHFNTERREQYFTTLNEQIKRLESIIQNSVEIISLEDKQKELVRQPIQWEILSENLQTRLLPQALEKNIALEFSPELADLPVIIGDSQQITQALYELIYNALNFTHGGGHVIVSGAVQTEGAKEWLTLSVYDNGPGIAPSEQSRIFDRFYRGQQAEAGHIPGTGLGLNMVSLIAQAHNGRLTLESYLGQGSTFTLWFPLN